MTLKETIQKKIKDQYEIDIQRHNNSMGNKQWIYCHSSYEIDGVEIWNGTMKKNDARPCMNTKRWRPARKEEIKKYYERTFNISL